MAINLLPRDLQVEHHAQRQQIVASIISVSLLVLLITAVAVIFSYRVYISRQLTDVNTQVNNLVEQVSKQKAVEGTLKAIHLKLDKVRELLNKNYPYGLIIENLKELAGPQVDVTGVEVVGQENFSVTGSTDSLASLAQYMKDLNEKSDNYQDVRVGRMNFDNKAFRYSFKINFIYQTETKSE